MTRYEIPQPDPDLREVSDKWGRTWTRKSDDDRYWDGPDGTAWWEELLSKLGPLSADLNLLPRNTRYLYDPAQYVWVRHPSREGIFFLFDDDGVYHEVTVAQAVSSGMVPLSIETLKKIEWSTV